MSLRAKPTHPARSVHSAESSPVDVKGCRRSLVFAFTLKQAASCSAALQLVLRCTLSAAEWSCRGQEKRLSHFKEEECAKPPVVGAWCTLRLNVCSRSAFCKQNNENRNYFGIEGFYLNCDMFKSEAKLDISTSQ